MFRHSIIRTDIINGIVCLSRYSHATEEKVKWVISVYEKWRAARNLEAKHNKNISAICPTMPIEQMTHDELNYSLSRFINETRKQNGEELSGKMLRELLF